ncbi:endonuclease/exonuclease/phosphatase family protein [Denitromonas iodatirespirans]|uniref:Endonuclease/exonuclease/phosphatase family protein n=1 Tax=Denitromonas iodatirespirans TaxID=2795389 RepID=A0A944DEQ3_DENI1|nr:endonuclease/exonuclease/phosphatase family protein [Denitromonas iodatirespirans]MBT0963631.1 endonuclease/exonuclease/phosphatase family protein [Denitromonas iodatirespirans]
MRVISWNIQWGRGADGVVNLSRIVERIREWGPLDVICLQEVAVAFEGLAGGCGEDEVALLAAAFPDYQLIHGPAVDVPGPDGGRSTFGNLMLSRLPVDTVFRHLLPAPPVNDSPSMMRGCIEAVLRADNGVAIRVMTTHLEYHAARQRLAQARWLQQRQAAVALAAGFATPARDKSGPFMRREMPVAAVLCGDFNCEPGAPAWAAIVDPAETLSPWQDAWRVLREDEAHPPSVGLHGADWPDWPYCCDYMFVSEALAPAVREVRYDAATAASDHQPVIIELDLSAVV